MIHPRTSLRVSQLPSPFSSFFRETASLREESDTEGWARTWSTACRRWFLKEFIRLLLPWPSWIKSSTKTSVWPTGRLRGLLEGGATSSVSFGSRSIPGRTARAESASRSAGSRGLGVVEGSRSSCA